MIHLDLLAKSFRYALHGVRVVFASEQSFRLQCLAAAAALVLGIVLEVSRYEFILLVILSGGVLTLELINSIFERIVDGFKPRLHPMVADIKDIMAAAVLMASLAAAAIGLLIFLPRLSGLF